MPIESFGAGVPTKEALAILRLAFAHFTSSPRAKLQFAKWKNEKQFKRLATKILDVTRVKRLWGPDEGESLYRFYYPSTIQFNDKITKRVSSLSELGQGRNFVIQGTAGQGKSIFLRFLTGQELRQKTSSGRVPIFVELRRVQGAVGIKELLWESFRRLGLEISDDLFDFYAESGRIALMLDAFDEIEAAHLTDALGYLEMLAGRYVNLQIIVTARNDSHIQRSGAFQVVKLGLLTASDHPHFLKRICTDENEAARLEKAIKQSSTEIKGLLTTPLLLTLLTVIYSAQQTIPDTLPGFYEQLFDVLFFKHDSGKPTFKRKRFTKLDDSAIRKLFEAFCFQARLEGKSVLSAALFRECLRRASDTCGIAVDDNAFRNELVRTVCLMQDEGFDLVFVHKSVSEFHAADFVRHSMDEVAEGFYGAVREKGRWRNWRQELRFLQQIDPVRYSRYFEIPNCKDVAIKYGIGADGSLAVSGGISKCDLGMMGPIIPEEGAPPVAIGWSRKIVVDMNYAEERLIEAWLYAMVHRVDQVLTRSAELLGELRAKGEPHDSGAPKRIWVKVDVLLRVPELAKIVEESFEAAFVRPLLDAQRVADGIVRREQEKLSLMSALAKRPISLGS
jgi:hypothetical protein